MQRYSVYQFDDSTFVVIDQIEQREICICGDYDSWEDSKERAQKIASLLNENDTRYQELQATVFLVSNLKLPKKRRTNKES